MVSITTSANQGRVFRHAAHTHKTLFLILLLLIANHVIEPQLIVAGTRAHDPQPVAELLLLQVLLGKVLEVSAAELLVRNHLDLAVRLLRDDNRLAEVAGPAVDFDAVVQELFEGGDVEDFVGRGLRGIDRELRRAC